jgi:hypothetical protein
VKVLPSGSSKGGRGEKSKGPQMDQKRRYLVERDRGQTNGVLRKAGGCVLLSTQTYSGGCLALENYYGNDWRQG